jgi:acyl carrier protein
VATVLGLPAGQRPDPATGFFDMGMDSLMAVELRNRLARRCGLTLASSAIFEYPTIQALAGHLVDTLLPETAAVADHAPGDRPDDAPAPVVADDSSDPHEDLDPAIAAELAALDALLQKN